MAKRALTRELYDALVAGFREAPGNASHAARMAGCDRRMAARGWTQGWTRYWSWARPIAAVLQEEQRAAKLKAIEAEQAGDRERAAQAEKLRARAVEAQTDEEQVLRVGRKDALGVLIASAQLQPAMQKLAGKVVDMVNDPAAKFSVKEAMGVLTRYSQLTQRALMSADLIVKLSRLDRGETTSNDRLDVVEYSAEEAADEIHKAGEALARARARGLLPEQGEGEAPELPEPGARH